MTHGQCENAWLYWSMCVTDHGADETESMVPAFEKGLVLTVLQCACLRAVCESSRPRYLIAVSISDTITCHNDPPRAFSPGSRSLLIQ